MKIFINSIRLFARHGVLPQERETGGMYKVSVSVDFDFTKATLTDSVADTINYADILDIVKREMAIPSGLLEHVAGRIANAIFCRLPQVSAASVTVIKENPPMGADCGGAGVSLDWRNPGLKDA